MGIDRRALKRQAKQAMILPRPTFFTVMLVYLLITSWSPALLELLLPAELDLSTFGGLFSLFFSILLTLYTTVVSFGYDLWSLWTARRLNPGLGSLVEGFSVAGRVLWMYVLMFFRAAGWAMLFLIVLLSLTLFFVPAPIVELFILLAAVVLIWIFLLRYALAPYLLADHPDDGARAALRRSTELMRGWKMELFKLELSFAGWYLLSAVLSSLPLIAALYQVNFFSLLISGTPQEIFGVYYWVSNSPLIFFASQLLTLPVLIWFTPYLSVTRACFYEFRLQVQRQDIPPIPPL